jgi:hypothetical protein
MKLILNVRLALLLEQLPFEKNDELILVNDYSFYGFIS